MHQNNNNSSNLLVPASSVPTTPNGGVVDWRRDITKELWQVNDERAAEYQLDMRAKLEA